MNFGRQTEILTWRAIRNDSNEGSQSVVTQSTSFCVVDCNALLCRISVSMSVCSLQRGDSASLSLRVLSMARAFTKSNETKSSKVERFVPESITCCAYLVDNIRRPTARNCHFYTVTRCYVARPDPNLVAILDSPVSVGRYRRF